MDTLWGVWIFTILAVLLFIGFFVRMIQHENHAYRQIIEHQPVERGPAAEGEPTPSYAEHHGPNALCSGLLR